jgi:hypothetical protein
MPMQRPSPRHSGGRSASRWRVDREVAAPPDDGGHLGNFTVPGDVVSVNDVEATARASASEASPPLHVQPTRTGTIDRVPPRPGIGPFGGTVVIAVLCAIVVALLYLIGG